MAVESDSERPHVLTLTLLVFFFKKKTPSPPLHLVFKKKTFLTGWNWMVQMVGMKNPEESKHDHTKNWRYEKKALRDGDSD